MLVIEHVQLIQNDHTQIPNAALFNSRIDQGVCLEMILARTLPSISQYAYLLYRTDRNIGVRP